ncbi:MAG: YlxR family protein [Clostridia bacterium]|nr:YlxR family protein [Clostridia bacterium]
MNPLRMCVVCRERKEKGELIRVVKTLESEAMIDFSFKAQGRGAYVCKNEDCIKMAEKRKAFEKALRCSLDSEFYEKLGEKISE